MKDALLKNVAKKWFAFQSALDASPEAAKEHYEGLMLCLREYEFFVERAEEVRVSREGPLRAFHVCTKKVAARNEAQLEACESQLKTRRIEGWEGAGRVPPGSPFFTRPAVDAARQRTLEMKDAYREARVARSNYEEYEKLAALISKYPSREKTEEVVANLQRDIDALEAQNRDLERQFAVRTGQFQHLLYAIRALGVALTEPGGQVPAVTPSAATLAATAKEPHTAAVDGELEDGEL